MGHLIGRQGEWESYLIDRAHTDWGGETLMEKRVVARVLKRRYIILISMTAP